MKKKTHNVTRKLLAFALCMAMAMYFIASPAVLANNAFNSPEDVYTMEQAIRSLGNTIDSGGEIASGYGTTVTLHMDRDYYSPYFRAGAVGNENNLVYCYVTTPAGYTYPLGTVTANGSTTPYYHIDYTAPAGDYVFTFEGTDSGTTGFLAFMYSNF